MIREDGCRLCKSCQTWLVAEGNFYPHGKTGYSTYCKSCDKARAIEYQKTHPDKKKLYDKNTLIRANNDPTKKTKIADQKRSALAVRKAADPEKYREAQRLATARYQKNNPERAKEIKDAFALRHPERIAAYQKKHYEKSPERRRIIRARAKLRHHFMKDVYYRGESASSMNHRVWTTILEVFDHKCCYCDSPDNITIEHLTPMARGGTNEIGNIAPACKACNAKKHAKTAEDFCPERVEEIRRKAATVLPYTP